MDGSGEVQSYSSFRNNDVMAHTIAGGDYQDAMHFYAITYNGGDKDTVGSFSLSMDGVSRALSDINDPASGTENKNYLGLSGSDANPFKGTIGEVWVFEGTLSSLVTQHIYDVTKWRYL